MEDKVYVRMLTRKEACPLSFSEWLVYSYLARHRQQMTADAVAKAVGLNRKTVNAAKSSLMKLGLIEDKLMVSGEISLEWFFKRDGGRQAYWKYYVPSDDNTLKMLTNAVLSLTLSHGSQQSVNGYAKQLGIAKATARKAIMELEELALLERRKPKREAIPDEWYRKRKPKIDWSALSPADKADALERHYLRKYKDIQWRDVPVYENVKPSALAVMKLKQFLGVATKYYWRKPVIDKFVESVMKLAGRWRNWDGLIIILQKAAEVLSRCGPERPDGNTGQIAAFTQGRFARQWTKAIAPLVNRDECDVPPWRDMGEF